MKYKDFENKKRYSRNVVIPSLKLNGYLDKAEKLLDCGKFIQTKICQVCHAPHFVGSYYCHDRLCPICAKKRTLSWCIKLVPILSDLLKRGYHLNMLTFTIRTNKETTLKDAIETLNNTWRYMTNTCKEYRKYFSENILGGVRSLEVKMGENENEDGIYVSTDCWHPHFHCLVVTHGTKPYKILHSELFDIWNSSLSCVTNKPLEKSLGTVNIKSIHCSNESTLMKSILEVFKYITKFDWQGERVPELVDCLNNVRGLNTFGNLRYFLNDSDVEKLIDKPEDELYELICAVCGNDSFVDLDLYDSGRMVLYDFDKKSDFAYLSELTKFNEID